MADLPRKKNYPDDVRPCRMTDALKPEYPPLPEPWQCFQENPGWHSWENVIPSAAAEPGVVPAFTADQMRAYVDADRAARSQPSALTDEQIESLRVPAGKFALWESGSKAYRLAFARAILSAAGSRSSDAEELRALLKESREWVEVGTSYEHDDSEARDLMKRIDAALRSQPMGRGE